MVLLRRSAQLLPAILTPRTQLPGKEEPPRGQSSTVFLFFLEEMCVSFIPRCLVCDVLLKICCIIKTNLILSTGEAEGIKQITFVGFGKNWRGNKVLSLMIGKKVNKRSRD